MQSTFRLPALDADVVIDGGAVSITGDDDEIRVGVEEWETLRETLRFDDIVDYKSGESPMTLFQLRIIMKLQQQCKRHEAEINYLRNGFAGG